MENTHSEHPTLFLYTNVLLCGICVASTGRRLPPPPPLHVAKTGKNHLNEEISPLLPTGIGEKFSQTISNLGHAALLRRCELPPINESTGGGPLVNSVL
jgi:hypothetical protein